MVGGLTTYFGCYSTLTSRIGRVPSAFVANRLVIGLALICGLIAAGACWISDRDPGSAISTVLGLKTPDPWRGLVVGASVLILIRSKLFNIQDSPFGGDYLYQLGRDTAIQDVNAKWTIVRSLFQNRNISAALGHPQFEPTVLALINANIQARPQAFRDRVKNDITTVTGNRPPAPFGAADAAWVVYYRALIGVALDACGPDVVATMTGFQWP